MMGGEEDLVKQIFSWNHDFGILEILSFFLLTLFLGWFLYRWSLFNHRSFPPGPIGLPIIGHIGIFIRGPSKELFELSKKYGKIFSLYFGSAYTIVVTDYEIAKEIVSHPAALSRPNNVFGFIPGGGGFSGTNGLEWQEQRRFVVAKMTNLRGGKGVWENMIKAQVVDFIEEVDSWKGKPTEPGKPLLVSVSCNNIALLIGRRLSKKANPETLALIAKAVPVLSEHFSSSGLSAILKKLPKYLVRLRIGEFHENAQILDELANFFRKEIKKHVNCKEEEDEAFICSYLKEIEKQNAANNRHYFSENNLLGHLMVLVFASSDTVATSLHWIVLLMAAYPEIQKRVQQEIDDVIGRNYQAGWDERKRLPYTMAVILEMERFCAVNPLFPPRLSTQTFECGGYTIPKGSKIVVYSWAVMHDPKYWDNPMEFIPERFIRSDGKDPSKTPGLSIFSFGKRNCPGNVVALMAIFTYFTALMQNFTIQPPPGRTADLTEGHFAAVITPVKQQLCFVERG